MYIILYKEFIMRFNLIQTATALINFLRRVSLHIHAAMVLSNYDGVTVTVY